MRLFKVGDIVNHIFHPREYSIVTFVDERAFDYSPVIGSIDHVGQTYTTGHKNNSMTLINDPIIINKVNKMITFK